MVIAKFPGLESVRLQLVIWFRSVRMLRKGNINLRWLLAATLLPIIPGSVKCQSGTSQLTPQTQQQASPDCQLTSSCDAQDRSAPIDQAPGGTSRNQSQPFNSQNYRDDNALPNQSRARNPDTLAQVREPLTEFQKYVAETTGQVLPIFGARLFRQVPTTFSPTDQIPVPADAVVGPGDLLRIRIWGQVNFSADLRVDRSGEIYLPQVGPVHVAGLQYSDLDAHLQTAIGRVYRNFNVSAQLGQIRSIQVYVAGRAKRPGTYTVSSLSTLIDALFASGGPALDGSLRHVQLKRTGKVVVDLDLYDLLVNGDKSGDAKLEPGDVIFIPPVGPQAALVGSVKTPAIYELKPSETVAEVLAQAAGVTNLAQGTQLQLERMGGSEGRSAEAIGLTPEGLSLVLHDGDVLRFEPRVPSYAKTVTLRGNSAKTGRYTWHSGMRLGELFPDRAALLTRNYWWQRTQLGLPSPEFERNRALERLRQPDAVQPLPTRAEEQARSRFYQEQLQRQTAGATGQTRSGDSSAAIPYNEEEASAAAAALASEDQENTADQSSRMLPYGEQGQQTAATARRDVITENTARSAGITDVTLSAPELDWSYAVIERLNPETLKTSLLPFDLGRLVMGHDSTQDLELQPGDVVTIFSQADIHVPVADQTRLVRLEGEFAHSGVYSVAPGETLQQLIQRAGGLTPAAYLFGSEFTRASVRAVQQRRLDEYVQQLQLQVNRGVLATSAAASSSAADLASASVASREGQALVERLRQIKATGRIVLDLRAGSQGSLSLPELGLEDGDTYYVPSVPANISVIGAVYDQNSFVFKPGLRVRNYMRLAGGANRDADRRHAFVVRADGSVISQDQIGQRSFERLIVLPGDTIVVSEKTFGPTRLRNFLNFSQLFAQLAIGSAVLTNL